jgi:hypothetical protein
MCYVQINSSAEVEEKISLDVRRENGSRIVALLCVDIEFAPVNGALDAVLLFEPVVSLFKVSVAEEATMGAEWRGVLLNDKRFQ